MENNNNQQADLLGPKGLIKKDELVRLIIQCLYSLGFRTSASGLEAESNVSYKSSQFASLESQVLGGNWDGCTQVLTEIKDYLKNEATRVSALSLILRQRIRECMSRNDLPSALKALRKDYPALGVDRSKLKGLGLILLDNDSTIPLDDTVIDAMRQNLVTGLEKVLPPPITVPERRLESLVEATLSDQLRSCTYHNMPGAISLYEDHCCGKDYIPTETLQVLREHKDEVWFVQFSHNGEYLASSSSDCTAIIWTVPEQGNLTVKHTLYGHQKPVSFLSWSPDDTVLLTCGEKEVLKLWDVETGTCKRTVSEHVPILSSCAWFSDSRRIVFGSSGAGRSIYRFEIDQNKFTRWSRNTKPKITDLAMTPDGKNLICIFSYGYITIWNRENHIKWNYNENLPITSVCVSKESEDLLVNLIGHKIHLWNVASEMNNPRTYLGRKQAKFVIHSCFGGLDSMFIASGSEDSQVYIWHRHNEQPIKVLSGHLNVVNGVSWNPKWPQMLASASDDQTIRIWGPSGINKNGTWCGPAIRQP